MTPYSREIEVRLGPLPEYQGGGSERQEIRIFGNGTPDGLRIKFSVDKHIITTATPSVVSIYNLSSSLRSALMKSDLKVAVSAGWENVGLVPLYSGSLLAAVNHRQGPDIITDLISLPGWGGVMRSAVSKAFSGGAKLTNVVSALASAIPGVKIDKKLIDIANVSFGDKGWSFAGTANEGLDKLSRVYGFSWWLNKGVFHAVSDSKALEGKTPLISFKNGFLMRAEPMLASPMQVQAGVSISSLFNPFVEPGKKVQLESAMNPELNGAYKVHTLSHSGDTHSPQWDTFIQSWVVV